MINSIAKSEKGWTDHELGLAALKLFEEQTRKKAAGCTHALLLDSHLSHYSLPFLQYAKQHGIKVLPYPPHCTHALQGLDVVCFAKMKDVWKEEIRLYEELYEKPVTSEVFTGLFGKAFLQAFTPDLVKAAFSATVIHPFNPDVIQPAQMKPAEATSIKGPAPVLLSSPVRRVVRALREYWPLALELSPSTHCMADMSAFPLSASPLTPSHRKRPLVAVDPNNETPSKRACLVVSSLATSGTASFLIHRNPISLADRLAAPVFGCTPELPAIDVDSLQRLDPLEHHQTWPDLEEEVANMRAQLKLAQRHIAARDIIIEAANAQMVLQGLYGAKQRASLIAKEQKPVRNKRVKQRVFADGMGRCLTNKALMAAFEAADEEERRADEAKTQRKRGRKSKKADCAAYQVKWTDFKRQRETEIAEWKVRWEDVPARQRPSDCPRRPARATHAEMDALDDSNCDSDSEGGEGEE
jgi:hypothetical protein